MSAKRPLTPAEMRQAFLASTEAIEAFDRLWWGLGSTMPAAVMDAWNRFNSRHCWLHQAIKDAYWDMNKRPIPEPKRDAKLSRWAWFDDSRPRGRKPRPLDRAEWCVLGDEVKAMRETFGQVGMLLQKAYTQQVWQPWFALSDRLDRLKSKLDGECHRQHPDWPEFLTVFYGPKFIDSPELLRSVDVARVALIRAA